MKVMIFGSSGLAVLTRDALSRDSPHEVVGFTVDAAYVRDTELDGLPVVAFEEIEKRFPPSSVAMIAPLGVHAVNGLRAEKHRAGKAKGYRFISYVSSRAIVWPQFVPGENCLIYEGVIVQAFAKLGDGVILRAGANVSHHVEIGDNCFIAGNACIGGNARIGERCFLGLNSTILDGVAVAPRCVIGAGAVVTQDTEADGTYVGVPARRLPSGTGGA